MNLKGVLFQGERTEARGSLKGKDDKGLNRFGNTSYTCMK
jgi:hypothetical protein